MTALHISLHTFRVQVVAEQARQRSIEQGRHRDRRNETRTCPDQVGNEKLGPPGNPRPYSRQTTRNERTSRVLSTPKFKFKFKFNIEILSIFNQTCPSLLHTHSKPLLPLFETYRRPFAPTLFSVQSLTRFRTTPPSKQPLWLGRGQFIGTFSSDYDADLTA